MALKVDYSKVAVGRRTSDDLLEELTALGLKGWLMTGTLSLPDGAFCIMARPGDRDFEEVPERGAGAQATHVALVDEAQGDKGTGFAAVDQAAEGGPQPPIEGQPDQSEEQQAEQVDHGGVDTMAERLVPRQE